MTEELFDLGITRTISASRSVVWTAWTEPELLKEWWCPKPWTSEVCRMDLRPGGEFHIIMHGPDGEISDNPGAFLEIIPQARIVFTSALVGDWRPASPSLAMTAIITMADAGDNTYYSARVLHKNAEDRDRHEAMGFYNGWGTCIEQLSLLAQQLTPTVTG